MSSCATCGTLADHVAADLKAGEALPPEVSRLEAIAGGNARRCPTCGALFLYTYGAVMASVERFKGDPELPWATRIELLRCAARVVRAR